MNIYRNIIIGTVLGAGAFFLISKIKKGRSSSGSVSSGSGPRILELIKIKSTAVDWNNSSVSVDLFYGLTPPEIEAVKFIGKIDPTTKTVNTIKDQSIEIIGNGQQTTIRFIKAGKIQRQAVIDFFNEKLVGFDAGSVGISGYSNIDTVTSIYGIGSVYDYNHPKGITHCFDGTYSDSHKGACSYHGGAHEIKLRKGKRDYSGKGNYEHYLPYRKSYKANWARKNKGSSDRVVTL
jgi:hypothetical protein